MRSEYEEKIAIEVMKWYGWGSPIGLSIFLLAASICAVVIRYVVRDLL